MVAQEFCRSAYQRERSAELVGNIGEEIYAVFGEPFFLFYALFREGIFLLYEAETQIDTVNSDDYCKDEESI